MIYIWFIWWYNICRTHRSHRTPLVVMIGKTHRFPVVHRCSHRWAVDMGCALCGIRGGPWDATYGSIRGDGYPPWLNMSCISLPKKMYTRIYLYLYLYIYIHISLSLYICIYIQRYHKPDMVCLNLSPPNSEDTAHWILNHLMYRCGYLKI